MPEFYDAAIIGGGPGGSTVATILARAGRRVILSERERFPRFRLRRRIGLGPSPSAANGGPSAV